MNIGATIHNSTPQRAGSGPAVRSEDRDYAQPELLQATRDEIRQITREIAQLARQDLPHESYFTQFLQHVAKALHSVAGIVWTFDEQRKATATATIGDVSSCEVSEHDRLLRQAVTTARPMALAPRSNSKELGVVNPTDHLLLIVPLQLEDRVTGIVEVFQRADRGPAVQRGYMNYLVQVAELAEAYLQQQQLRFLREQNDWSRELEQFLSRIHGQLDVTAAAYTITNEARRLTGVDRVSLVLGNGRRARVAVVSGLDSVDRRAEQVRLLARLAARVLRGREAIWLDTHGSDIPPQIEHVWNQYVDSSHVRRCAIIPLQAHQDPDDPDARPAPSSALVFEQLGDAVKNDLQAQRIEQISWHSTSALHNAQRHEGLFLMPLWRTLGKICDAIGGRHFTKTLLATVLFVAAGVALTTMSKELTVAVHGKMQPELRRTVFAGQDGVVTDVYVAHGQSVQAGEALAQLKNTDLDMELTSLLGDQTATREQIFSLQRTLLDDPGLDTAQQNQLHGELLQQQQLAHSIARQLDLLKQKQQQLTIRSDRAGQIVTWHVKDRLLNRPVQKGQALLALIDPQSDWELELYVPAQHSGHVIEAARDAQQPLRVTFVLSSQPGRTFAGTVKSIDHVAVQHAELGDAVRIRAAIDARQIPELKSDATVVAKIHCGETSLGYAWFHDLIDTVRSRIKFWAAAQ
jgi:multidrug resistance efflux pump